MSQARRTFRSYFAALFGLAAAQSAVAGPDYSKNIDNLMVVLRETEGANKQKPSLEPAGHAKAALANGKKVDASFAWFDLIGDMHIRFVFDGRDAMRNLSSEELADFNLRPEEALRKAVTNIKRVYGSAEVSRFPNGIMRAQGKSPDLDSSYFLDDEFWQSLLKQNPDGLVVAVPERAVLLFAPLSDHQAVAALRKDVGGLYADGNSMRISSALYLFFSRPHSGELKP
jgi:uncharacterized protein YtpQ (UPF0354 family)